MWITLDTTSRLCLALLNYSLAFVRNVQTKGCVRPIQIVRQCLFSLKKHFLKIISRLQFLYLRPVLNLATQVSEEQKATWERNAGDLISDSSLYRQAVRLDQCWCPCPHLAFPEAAPSKALGAPMWRGRRLLWVLSQSECKFNYCSLSFPSCRGSLESNCIQGTPGNQVSGAHLICPEICHWSLPGWELGRGTKRKSSQCWRQTAGHTFSRGLWKSPPQGVGGGGRRCMGAMLSTIKVFDTKEHLLWTDFFFFKATGEIWKCTQNPNSGKREHISRQSQRKP